MQGILNPVRKRSMEAEPTDAHARKKTPSRSAAKEPFTGKEANGDVSKLGTGDDDIIEVTENPIQWL